MTSLSRLFVCLAVGVALLTGGCASQVERPAFPQISFRHLPQISLDVARIETENRYVAPNALPNVEHTFPVSPAASALNWGRDRLKPVGTSGVARVIVERASVVEVPLERTSGLKGIFTKDQAERYDGTIVVAVEILGADGDREGVIRATAKRSQTVPENISLNEREKIWFEMTEAMMKTIDEALEGQIKEHFGRWVR